VKKIILLTASLLLCSCAIATVKTDTTDGKTTRCEASYYSLFKDISESNLSACGAKGKSAGSTVNAALLQDLAKALLTP